MKVFIWERVEQCSNRWHSQGGVVIIADTEERALELANQQYGCNIKQDEKFDYCINTDSTEEKGFIFPDAGCC